MTNIIMSLNELFTLYIFFFSNNTHFNKLILFPYVRLI